jgi:hypothetical protein
MPDKWLTLAAAATALNVHPRTIERRIASAKIQSRRTDDGQLQVLINVPDAPDNTLDPLETVKELAQDQVSLATGSASALVRFAQDDAQRARHELERVRQEAVRARQGARAAWISVAGMGLAIVVAVGWTSHKLTQSTEQLRNLDHQSARVQAEAQQLMIERDEARSQTNQARIEQANTAGRLAAIERASDKRPTTQPQNIFQRVAGVLAGD